MLEKDIETEILTWLNYQPECFAFKVNTAGFFDTKRGIFRKNTSRFVIRGTSDIIGSWKGKLLSIEVKTPQGLRKFLKNPGQHELNQKAFLEKVQKMGGIALVASSLDQVVGVLSGA